MAKNKYGFTLYNTMLLYKIALTFLLCYNRKYM